MKRGKTVNKLRWESLQKCSKSLCTFMTILCLGSTPILSDIAFANAQTPNPDLKNRDEHKVNQNQAVNQVGALMQNFIGMHQSHQNQMQMINQQAQLQQMMTPQYEPARFFRQCQMLSAPNFPEGICSQPPTSPHEAGLVNAVTEGAERQIEIIKMAMSEAKNQPDGLGIQCLEDARNQTNTQLRNRLEGLTALITEINKQNQKFRDDNQQLLNAIQDDYALLTGQNKGRRDLASQSQNHADLFSNECQNIMAKESGVGRINQIMNSSGLLGLQNDITSERGEATSFLSNRSSVISDIETSIQNIQRGIRNHGVETTSGDFNTLFQRIAGSDEATRQLFGSDSPLVRVVGSEFTEIQQRKNDAQQTLASLGVSTNIPTMDGNFRRNLNDSFIDDIVHEMRRSNDNLVVKCMTGQGSSARGMSLDDVLASVHHSQIEDRSIPAVREFQGQLRQILNSDSSLEAKLDQIRQLEERSGQIRITYLDSESRMVQGGSIYNYFQQASQSCRREVNRTTATSQHRLNDNIQRVRNELHGLANEYDTFASNLANNISDTLINCQGRDLPSGANSCHSGMMDKTNPQFCVRHATQCANQINSCYSEVRQVVETKQNEIQQKANQYNNNIQAFVAAQEQLLTQIKNRLLQDQTMIQQFFPGADFSLEANLFITMPEMVDEFGVQIRGGSDFIPGGLEELAERVHQMQAKFSEQANKVNNVLNDYISKQRENLRKQKHNLSRRVDQCERKLQAFASKANKDYERERELFQKSATEVQNVCNRFEQLGAMNPHAACDGFVQDLFKSSLEASAHLSAEAKRVINDYNNHCAEFQNERRVSSKDEFEGDLVELCKANGGVWDKSIRDIANRYASSMNGVSGRDIINYMDTGDSRDIENYRDNQHVLEQFRELHLSIKDGRISQSSTSEDIIQDLGDRFCKGISQESKCRQRINDQLINSINGYSETNICNNIGIEAFAKASASATTDNNNTIRTTADRLRSDIVRDNYSRANIILGNLVDGLNPERGIASANLPSAFGENTSSIACHAQAGQQRGGQDFLQMFDQMTGGDFATGRGTSR